MPPKKLDDETDFPQPPEQESPPLPPPGPFSVAPILNQPPTTAQHDWLLTHPQYRRISHAVLGRFTFRGTLMTDGHFVAETAGPIMDGGGNFGVGVPI